MNIAVLDFERWDSGITSYALAAAEGLKAQGHKIIFVGIEGAPPAASAEKRGLETLKLRSGFSLASLLTLIRKEHIGALNPHDGKSHILCALAGVLMKNTPRLVRTYADARPVRRHAFLWKRTDAFIAAAAFIKDDFVKKGLSADKVKLIYQPAGNEFCAEGETAALKGRQNVSIVGRLDPVKGHKTFINAAAIVSRNFPELFFYVVGAEKNVKLEELRKYAETKGLKNIALTGFAQKSASYMRASDIGVIASSGSEAVSRVAAEWMFCEKALVSTRAGCLGELVEDGKTGLLVDINDSAAMAAAIEKLLSDEALRLSMGRKAALRAAGMFDSVKFTQSTEKILKGDL